LIPVTLAGALQSGALQGLQEFFLLSKQSILSALIKLVVSLLLVYAGFSVVGVMVAVVLASLASWGYGYLATRPVFATPMTAEASHTEFTLRSVRGLFTTILVTTLLLVLLSNIDVLMAKHFLPADLAGQYGALSTIGKILIYGIGAFITVLLPMVTAAHAEGKGGGVRILGLSLAIIAACSVCILLLFTFFSGPIVTVLFGLRYIQIAPYLGLFTVAMACISLASAFINYFVAVNNSSFIYFLSFGIAAEVAIIALHHSSLSAMTTSLVYSSVLLLMLMLVNFGLTLRLKTV
jgi:O-antigen/teichoic acid export membrane protein